MLPPRTIFLAVLLIMWQANEALSSTPAHSETIERRLVRGRALHGYMLSLAKTGQQAVTNVQRPKTNGQLDTKIPGTGLNVDLTSCAQGGTPAVDLTQAVPATQTYQPGETVTVAWTTTITHDNAPGVRIALRYVNQQGDNFADHVLQTGLNGAQDGSSPVQLPNTQGRAELMWSWESQADGGYYISCADIVIGLDDSPGQTGQTGQTGDGNTGNNVIGATPSSAELIDEAGSTAVIVISILVIIGVVVCVAYTAMNSGGNSAPPLGQGNSGGRSLPRPASQRPKSVAKGLRGTPAGGLPPGWAATVDGDGDTYYYHQDGRTSWEIPTQ